MGVLDDVQVGDDLLCGRTILKVAALEGAHVVADDGRLFRVDTGHQWLGGGRTDRSCRVIPLALHLRLEREQQLEQGLLQLLLLTCDEVEQRDRSEDAFAYLTEAQLGDALDLVGKLKALLGIVEVAS